MGRNSVPNANIMLTNALEGYFAGLDLSLRKFFIIRFILVVTGILLIVPEVYTEIFGIVCFGSIGVASIIIGNISTK